MNERRKTIILSEIKYWKQNNLLPGHYCDFLSTLYAGGEETEAKEVKKSASVLHKEKMKKRWLLVSVAMFSLVIAGLMQVMNEDIALYLGAAGVLVLLTYATVKSIRSSVVMPFTYIASAFLLLIMSLKLWTLFFSEQPMLLIGLLILNCVMWLFAGRFLKLLYFTLSGSIGLVCIIGFLIFQY